MIFENIDVKFNQIKRIMNKYKYVESNINTEIILNRQLIDINYDKIISLNNIKCNSINNNNNLIKGFNSQISINCYKR